MPRINPNLIVKSLLAIGVSIAIGLCALLGPGLVSGSSEVKQKILAELEEAAKLEAEEKAQAVIAGDYGRVEKRFLVWRMDQPQAVFALYDAQGRLLVGSADAPVLEDGAGLNWLNEALAGGSRRGAVQDFYVAGCPLGPAGELKPGEQAVGMFLVAMDKKNASAGSSRRSRNGAFGLGAILFTFLVAGVLMLAANYLIFVRPIRRLASASKQVNLEAGRFPLVPEKNFSGDELGRLVFLRNQLVERLREEHSLAHQANGLLEQAEAKYRRMIENLRDIVFRTDLTGQFQFVSSSFEQLLGIAPHELYDSPERLFAIVAPDDQERVRMAFSAIVQGENASGLEFRLLPKMAGAAPLWFRLSHIPVADSSGRIQGIEGMLRDITAAKRFEMECAELRFRMDALHELSMACRKNLSRRELFDLFACQSAETVGMERAAVIRIVGDSYRIIGLSGLPEEAMRSSRPLADSPQGKVALTGRPLALLDEEAWREFGLDSPCVGAPILDRQGETIGAICCYGNAHAATEGNIRTVSLFCDLLHPQIASMSESAGDMADAVPGGRMEEYRRKLSEADTKLDALRLACLNAAFSADPSAGLAGDERAARLSRVARYARIFAEEFGVKPGKADLLSEAVASAILDAGKPQEHTIETPDLFAETDPDLAKRDEPVREPLRRSADIELRRIARLIAEGRHERWDGAGGPQGLKGDSIPVDARVVALAETLEMLTGKFPGRDGEMPVGEALETIRFGAGRHFSLEEVRAVEALESEIRAICES